MILCHNLNMVNENTEGNINYFAETDSRNRRVRFGIKPKDRERHMYVIGKTGMGKSTLLENMAIQDIENGEGIAFIDPHGGTAEKLLEYVPPERVEDVLYFAPFDMEYPVSFNVIEDVDYDKRHLVVSGLMNAFEKIWADQWSSRMEYILSNTLLALLEYPESTLLDVNRVLVDKAFRDAVVENISDPLVRAFWVEEFAKYTDRYTQEATPAIQNKIGQFTSNPVIRNIIGQPYSSFDIRKMMDNKKIFIANLSKGRMGETNANLLGSMLITKMYLAAMSRADHGEEEIKTLPSFFFYVDEFQSFANKSFADILSEARKYKLALLIAHQYIEQMSEDVRAAVFGNVGTMATFRVGAYDAEVLEKEFSPQFTANDLVNLGFAQIYLKLMINGVSSQPFSAVTLPPIPPPESTQMDEVIAASREKFASPREEVEKAIRVRRGEEKGGAPEESGEPDPSQESAYNKGSNQENQMNSTPEKEKRSEKEKKTAFKKENAQKTEGQKDQVPLSKQAPPPESEDADVVSLQDLKKKAEEKKKAEAEQQKKRKSVDVGDHVQELRSALSNILGGESASGGTSENTSSDSSTAQGAQDDARTPEDDSALGEDPIEEKEQEGEKKESGGDSNDVEDKVNKNNEAPEVNDQINQKERQKEIPEDQLRAILNVEDEEGQKGQQ